MRKLIIFITAVISTSLFAEMPTYDYIQGIKTRQDKMIQYYASLDAKHLPFQQIAAKLRLGQDVERCKKDFEWALDNPSGEMFFGVGMISCYLWGYQYWTEEIHAKARKVWQTYAPDRGDTENHWVYWHTGILLAAQTWPDITFANGRTADENRKDAESFLNSWIDTFSIIGEGEFDSPCYYAVYLNSMLVLHEFTKDPVLKKKSEMVIEWWLTDFAIDYLNGAYTGGHSRVYDRDILLPGREGGEVYGYIFFGNSQFPVKNEGLQIGILTSYIPPQIIQDVALDRDTPYVVEKRKRVRNIMRYSDDMNPPVYKENYMSRSFSVGCNDGGIQQPIQIHTWGVTYPYEDATGRKYDEIFALHPYYSDREGAMFFPEKPKMLVNAISKGHTTYNKEDKWVGGSPFERMFQYKNAIIGLYDIDKDFVVKHIDYHFPKNLARREIDGSGWIFCQGGNAYIAIRPFKPGDWSEETKRMYKEGAWSDESSCYRLRSPYLRNGYVAEAFESSDFKSWDDFKNRMLGTKLDLSKLDSEAEVSYTTSGGNVMKFKFPDKRYLNGDAVDYKDMPLFRSPYVNGNNKVMNITHGGQQLTIDFGNVETISKIIK